MNITPHSVLARIDINTLEEAHKLRDWDIARFKDGTKPNAAELHALQNATADDYKAIDTALNAAADQLAAEAKDLARLGQLMSTYSNGDETVSELLSRMEPADRIEAAYLLERLTH